MDIEKKISKAERIYARFKDELLNDDEIRTLLDKLNSAIESTWRFMRELGITEICKECALETGSCCKRWVEDRFDVATLLINLLLGVELPKKRYKEDGCFFVGEKGCRLKAREVICVTFLCDRILKHIGEKETELQTIAGESWKLFLF
jgi:hypothetical protein